MSRRRWAWACGVFFLSAVGAQAAVTLGPTGGHVAAVAGVRALERGDVADAIPFLQRAAAQGPDAWTLYHLGTAQLAAGDAASGAAALERGLTLQSSPELRRRALHNLGRARLDQALAASPGEVLPSALEAVVASRDALRLMPAPSSEFFSGETGQYHVPLVKCQTALIEADGPCFETARKASSA